MPPPAVGSMSKEPPTTAARSRMPTRPIIVFEIVEASNPTPSSSITRDRVRPRRSRTTPTDCACACRRHVVQGLLGDAIQRRLDFWCDTLIAESFDVKPRPHIRVPRPFTDVVLEHRFQTEIVEGCGTQFPRQKVDIAIDLRQEGVGLGERRLHIGHVGRDGANRLEFQTERRQLLSKVIVEIPGDPAPLFLLRNDQTSQQADTRLFRIAKLRAVDSRRRNALGVVAARLPPRPASARRLQRK